MLRMMRMIILPWAPPTFLGSARRDVGEAAGLPDVPKWPKAYVFQYLGARPGISFLSQRSLIRSPSEARLCVFRRIFQWLGPQSAPDCSHSHIVGAGRSGIILWIIHLALQPYMDLSDAKLMSSQSLECFNSVALGRIESSA